MSDSEVSATGDELPLLLDIFPELIDIRRPAFSSGEGGRESFMTATRSV
jgi:hypothetical protein